jgi:hypothetical protein
MKTEKSYIILYCRYITALIGLHIASCTAPIELDTRNSEPVIVIYGCLTDEYRNHFIRITSSSPYFQQQSNRPVSDALVQVVSSEGKSYDFKHFEDGVYVSVDTFACVAGTTYKLSVTTDFDGDAANETYTAETTPLPPLTVDSIAVISVEMMGFRHYSLIISMQDPPETDNYYLYKYFVNDSITNDKLSRLIVSDDGAYNGAYLQEVAVSYFEDANNEKVVERVEDNDYVIFVKPGDSVRLQTLNIEQGYYQFINDCSRERRGENPIFGGPPSNITTNISGNGTGYFTSYCVRELTAKVK